MPYVMLLGEERCFKKKGEIPLFYFTKKSDFYYLGALRIVALDFGD